MKKKIILLCMALSLLIISIKFFPFHCNSKACLLRESVKEQSTDSVLNSKRSLISLNTKEIIVGNNSLNVEIADTESLRERGLSGKEDLREGAGMLFVFPTDGKYGFWMKDMNFPIDIIWIKKNKIIGIENSLSPNTYPEIFYANDDVNFVLEVPAGFSLRHNIKIGDLFFYAN